MKKKTIKVNYLIVGIGLLILFDMWSINKRYLDTDDFVDKKKMDRPFQITKADDLILKDKKPTRSFESDPKEDTKETSALGTIGLKPKPVV